MNELVFFTHVLRPLFLFVSINRRRPFLSVKSCLLASLEDVSFSWWWTSNSGAFFSSSSSSFSCHSCETYNRKLLQRERRLMISEIRCVFFTETIIIIKCSCNFQKNHHFLLFLLLPVHFMALLQRHMREVEGDEGGGGLLFYYITWNIRLLNRCCWWYHLLKEGGKSQPFEPLK